MTERNATIQNGAGIHCRPSTVIARELGAYKGVIVVTSPHGKGDPRLIMDLLRLELGCGTELTICVEGPNEEDMCRRVVELFETCFDFPPKQQGGGSTSAF